MDPPPLRLFRTHILHVNDIFINMSAGDVAHRIYRAQFTSLPNFRQTRPHRRRPVGSKRYKRNIPNCWNVCPTPTDGPPVRNRVQTLTHTHTHCTIYVITFRRMLERMHKRSIVNPFRSPPLFIRSCPVWCAHRNAYRTTVGVQLTLPSFSSVYMMSIYYLLVQIYHFCEPFAVYLNTKIS